MRHLPLLAATAALLALAGGTAWSQTATPAAGVALAGQLDAALSADELLDRDIHDASGKEIAEIEDLLIGPDHRVTLVILELDEGLLDMGERKVAVTLDDLQLVPRGRITMSLSKEELAALPEVEEEDGIWRVADD